MIAKASQRGNASQLISHLKSGENERVTFIKNEGLMAQNMDDSVDEMMLVAAGSRATKPLFHAILSPEKSEKMTQKQWGKAWEIYREVHGLEGLQYAIVEHVKNTTHQHAVFNRVDPETLTARNLNHTHVKNELASRLCELEFGHELIKGHHNLAVINHLKKNGRNEKAEALAHLAKGQTPQALMSHKEHQMQRRGVPVAETRAELAEAWRVSDSPQAFELALAERGYLIAQGDKVAVAINSEAGREIPLLRNINAGLKAGGIARIKKAQLVGRLAQEHLPDVDAARETFVARLTAIQKNINTSKNTQEKYNMTENNRTGRLAPVGFASKAIKAKNKPEDRPQWRKAREKMLFENYGQYFENQELSKYWRIQKSEDGISFKNNNGEIIDQGEVLSVDARSGKAQLDAARAAVAIASAKGWGEVEATGTDEFRAAIFKSVIEAQQKNDDIKIQVAERDRETYNTIRAEIVKRQGVDMTRVRELHKLKTGNELKAATGASASNTQSAQQNQSESETQRTEPRLN